ncbi:hypothetical protein HY493_04500 [Candidatus Woesearchaeota archaeon]|nr:hypothetical protein [Candidatus Woesearchaeota archaeon]
MDDRHKDYIRSEPSERKDEHRVYRVNLLKPVEPEFAKLWGERIWRALCETKR